MIDRSALVKEFQAALGRDVPNAPSVEHLDRARLLAQARLVFEEAVEAVEALGCQVVVSVNPGTYESEFRVECDPDSPGFSLERAAHELVDVAYATEDTAAVLGLPFDELFEEVHRSNMTKVWKDAAGNVALVRHPVRSGYVPYRSPDIAGIIARSRHASEDETSQSSATQL
jgi:sugar phosphate isomerase/epimerase